MSAHKDHHSATVEVDGAPPVTVFYRWAWQAWLADRVFGMALGGAR